ncbi:hypothetical protein DFH09DRAFT_1059509 [Mycena vulgaris]|nr:hypothetical protein DFH09DRAFT_1059509 [Mycena vulgaris]
MAINLEQNKHTPVPLGPFDGRVGAVVHVGPEHYFITTNTAYVPAMPPTEFHDVYMRDNMRFGIDDPTLHPQKYSPTFSHFAAIPRRETRPDIAVMWYDPTPQDFVKGSAITRNLGRISPRLLNRLLPPINKIMESYHSYRKSIAPTTTISPLFTQVTESMLLAVERLQGIPSIYPVMQFEVASVQRAYLELEALLHYFTIHDPRMHDLPPLGPPLTDVDSLTGCLGAFVTDALSAQRLFRAGLPFWFLRPTIIFSTEIVREVVNPRAAPPELDRPRQEGQPKVYSGPNIDAKIQAIFKSTRQAVWYTDPFSREAAAEESEPSYWSPPKRNAEQSTRFARYVLRTLDEFGSHSLPGNRGSKSGPQPQPTWKPPLNPTGRDKFVVLQVKEMPDAIQAWATALGHVNRSVPSISTQQTDRNYLLPEPALLVTSQFEVIRQRRVHHWVLLRDLFIYLIGVKNSQAMLLTSQEWRDVLDGKLEARGLASSRTGKRSRRLAALIKTVVEACEMDKLEGIPVPEGSFPPYSASRMREILWELAETNFRFELSALDIRASKKERARPVSFCYAGGTLLGIDLELARRGLASPSLRERHRYHVRLAALMLDWETPRARPAVITAMVPLRTEWTEPAMQELENAVAQYYTQSFYDLFGRAAVIPMCLAERV